MTVEIISTQFIAKPEDLGRAYALYQERIAQAEATVYAYSPAPLPQDSDFSLWSLRTEAVYSRLDSPEKWQLYELNALVEFNEDDDDAVKEKFFFEDDNQASVFPGQLGGLFDMNLRREPQMGPENAPDQQTLTYVTVAFLALPQNERIVSKLFSQFVKATDPVVDGGEPTQANQVTAANYAGPLWAKAAQHELDKTGDNVHHGVKELWLGRVVIDYDAKLLAKHLPESLDPNNFVLANLYPEPF